MELSLQSIINAAKDIYGCSPLAKLAAAQAVLESRLLSNPSYLSRKYYNLFGIKGKGTAGSVSLMTWEHINGKNIRTKAEFARNNSFADSFKQHKKLLSRPRYKHVMSAGSFEEAAQAIKDAGYATDPRYPHKLINVFNKHLRQYFE